MKYIENFCYFVIIAITFTLAYYATRKSFNVVDDSIQSIVDFMLGFITYSTYLIVATITCNNLQKWFKAEHWDKIEELKKVETK